MKSLMSRQFLWHLACYTYVFSSFHMLFSDACLLLSECFLSVKNPHPSHLHLYIKYIFSLRVWNGVCFIYFYVKTFFFCPFSHSVLNVSKFMRMHARGCIASSLCNTTETGTLLTAGYTVSRTCCNTDCCNGATAIQIPLTAALGAAVMSNYLSYSLSSY
uniref:UPAR/Ly6 domain-containing protein n=1 Tax=Sphaeramia orbicularis TaxID=375764 RepID=A0A672Z9Y7_9TELE